jgi:hypothetical protein
MWRKKTILVNSIIEGLKNIEENEICNRRIEKIKKRETGQKERNETKNKKRRQSSRLKEDYGKK